MQPGALRALEFDRIVEAVTAFAQTPMGAERLAAAAAVDRSSSRRPVARGDHRNRTLRHRPRRLLRCGPRTICRRRLERSPSRGARSRRCACSRSSPFSTPWTRRASAIRRAAGSFPLLEAASAGAASFKGESAQTRDKIDPSGDVVDHASPELRVDSRPAAQAEDASAQHARVVSARQGHVEVPAGSGRHRAQRPLRARGQGRAPRAASPASCTARRPAAPASISNRSAPSKSTTTSSRSRSRKPKKSGAFCSR